MVECDSTTRYQGMYQNNNDYNNNDTINDRVVQNRSCGMIKDERW